VAGSSARLVAGLTGAAVAVVGFLGYQASANAPVGAGGKKTRGGVSASASAPAPTGALGPSRARRNPGALPGGSGKGERVVYSLGADRVWLVGPGGRARRSFTVTPGTVDPAPGTYTVTSRSRSVVGTDGTPVEHVVRFASAEGVVIGFSAAAGKPRVPPRGSAGAEVRRTGGIRESRRDGTLMWGFATIGCRVVVVR
jgi:hypothetical protein